jgi:hypothetical protein
MQKWVIPIILAVAMAPGARAEQSNQVRISRVTPGYTYFNRPGAAIGQHNADVKDCATIAATMQAQDERTRGSVSGVAGALIENWIAGAAHNGVVAAGIENCMVVRGWRVVVLDEATGSNWSSQPNAQLRTTLAGQIGASVPIGTVARIWNNDAAHAGTGRFELRPPASSKQLSLRILPDGIDRPTTPAPIPAATTQKVTWASLTQTLPPEKWDMVPKDHALLVMQMKGVSGSNGVTLFFQHMPTASSAISGQPGVMLFQHGLSGGKKEGRYYVFDVEPGLWRLSVIHALSLCLGAPVFQIKPGDVVYGGSYDLGAANIGPDMSLDGPRTFLTGHAASAKLAPAVYTNGSVDSCAGANTIYSLEIPDIPFDPNYRWGSRAADPAVH